MKEGLTILSMQISILLCLNHEIYDKQGLINAIFCIDSSCNTPGLVSMKLSPSIISCSNFILTAGGQTKSSIFSVIVVEYFSDE